MFTMQIHLRTTKSKLAKIAVVTHSCYMGMTELSVEIYCLANANSWSIFHESALKNLTAHMNMTDFRVYATYIHWY